MIAVDAMHGMAKRLLPRYYTSKERIITQMKDEVSIHWFRQDLRLSDNPDLKRASKHYTVLPIYILNEINAAESKMGTANRWWLHHSLH
jgi:hypothetical protein